MNIINKFCILKDKKVLERCEGERKEGKQDERIRSVYDGGSKVQC